MRCPILVLASFVLAFAVSSVRADVDINFDSVSTGGFVTGQTVTNYLNSFGITLSNPNNAGDIGIYNENFFGSAGSPPYFIVASSGTNMFSWAANNVNLSTSFDMNFAVGQNQVSFTRTQILGDSSHSLAGYPYATWSATALDSQGNTLGSVSETGADYHFDVAAKTFTLGPYSSSIATVLWSSSGESASETAGAVIDDLTINSTPEPVTFTPLALAALCVARRRSRRRD